MLARITSCFHQMIVWSILVIINQSQRLLVLERITRVVFYTVLKILCRKRKHIDRWAKLCIYYVLLRIDRRKTVFFVMSKILGFVVDPFNVFLLLFLLGLVLLLKKKSVSGKILIVSGGLLLFVCGLAPIFFMHALLNKLLIIDLCQTIILLHN